MTDSGQLPGQNRESIFFLADLGSAKQGANQKWGHFSRGSGGQPQSDEKWLGGEGSDKSDLGRGGVSHIYLGQSDFISGQPLAGEKNQSVKLPRNKALEGAPAEVNLSCKANFRVIEKAHEAAADLWCFVISALGTSGLDMYCIAYTVTHFWL